MGVYDHFIGYSSYLLGKDVVTVWNQNVTAKAPLVIRIIGSFCKENRKKTASEAHKARIESLKKTIQEAQESSKNLDSDLPKTVATFPLTALYFQEMFEALIKVYEVNIGIYFISFSIFFSNHLFSIFFEVFADSSTQKADFLSNLGYCKLGILGGKSGGTCHHKKYAGRGTVRPTIVAHCILHNE